MSGLNVKFDCSNAAQHNLLSKLFCIEFRKERLNREQWGLESVGGGLFDQTKRGVFSFEDMGCTLSPNIWRYKIVEPHAQKNRNQILKAHVL